MASKHTPEPWYVEMTWNEYLPTKYDPGIPYAGGDRPDIFFQVGNYDTPACSKEDAERIVLCVNACKDIEDPRRAIEDSVQAVKDILDEYEPEPGSLLEFKCKFILKTLGVDE